MSYDQERAIELGHPSCVWRAGQDRRLDMIRQYIPAEDGRVLDVGCGLGLYLERFVALGTDAHGVDVDPERVAEAHKRNAQVRVGTMEQLPYPDGYFKLVFANEVLEHVEDDAQAVKDAVRVLAPGGHLVLFVPNRLYPFETHGFYWRGVYHFGNIPLINWLPDALRNRLCPHVRAYTRRQLRGLFTGLGGTIVEHRCVYAGYDNIVARHPGLGRIIRAFSYGLEHTPLQWFGLSHLIVFSKSATFTAVQQRTD